MSRAGPKTRNSPSESGGALARRISEALFLLVMVLALYLMISLLTHHPADPGWSRDAAHDQVRNLGGSIGAWISDLSLFLFGYMAYVSPLLVGLIGLRLLRELADDLTVGGGGFGDGELLHVMAEETQVSSPNICEA